MLANPLKDRVRGGEEALRFVQSGLYMLAVEEIFGFKPAGMLYCKLKKETSWQGWHAIESLRRLHCQERDEAGLREIQENARAASLNAIRKIREGETGPQPADRDVCRHCDFADICRGEGAGARQTENA